MVKKNLAEKLLVRLLMTLKNSKVCFSTVFPRIEKSQHCFFYVMRKIYLDIEDISTFSKLRERDEAIRMVCFLIGFNVLIGLLIKFSCKDHTDGSVFFLV